MNYNIYLDNQRFYSNTNFKPDKLCILDKYQSDKEPEIAYIDKLGKVKIYYTDVEPEDCKLYSKVSLELTGKLEFIKDRHKILILGATPDDILPRELQKLYPDSIIWCISNEDSNFFNHTKMNLNYNLFSVRQKQYIHDFRENVQFDMILFDIMSIWAMKKGFGLPYLYYFLYLILKDNGELYIPDLNQLKDEKSQEIQVKNYKTETEFVRNILNNKQIKIYINKSKSKQYLHKNKPNYSVIYTGDPASVSSFLKFTFGKLETIKDKYFIDHIGIGGRTQEHGKTRYYYGETRKYYKVTKIYHQDPEDPDSNIYFWNSQIIEWTNYLDS